MYSFAPTLCLFTNLSDTFIDKAFCHMIIIQEVLLLALCCGMTSRFFGGYEARMEADIKSMGRTARVLCDKCTTLKATL